MYCEFCGKKIDLDAKYCEHCGKQIKTAKIYSFKKKSKRNKNSDYYSFNRSV